MNILKAPTGFVSTEVDGHSYEADEFGLVRVGDSDHVAILKQHGFVDLNEEPAAPTAADLAAVLAAGAQVQAERDDAPVLYDVADDFPGIALVLLTAGVAHPVNLEAVDLLETLERHYVTAVVPEYRPGEFVAAAMTAAGLADLSDIQAVLDAVEAQFEPFKAFDPNGDNAPGGARSEPAQEEQDTRSLHGSSVLPAIIEIGGFKVQLGGVVCAAHGRFAEGINNDANSIDAWNALPDPEREALLQSVIDDASADPAINVPALIAEASIVERPETEPAPEPVEDPAERPDFNAMSRDDLVAWTKARGAKYKSNPSQAVAAQTAHDYWDAKYGARA